VIYLKLSNSNNYFFEISKKKRLQSPKESSNVIVFSDLKRYSEIYVEPEKPITLATSLFQKISKKKIDFVSMKSWKVCKSGISWSWNKFLDFKSRSVEWVKQLIFESNKLSENEEASDELGDDPLSAENSFNFINHVKNLHDYQNKKFMFLNSNLRYSRLIIPPFSSLNIPKMIMVDFNSKRHKSDNNSSFFFKISNSDLDFTESFEDDSTTYDHRNMTFDQIEDSLDEMVLVMKNNLTNLSIIPIKYS
jgi:hypothetical protein